VRLIDDEGTQVGIVATREALQIAEERGLDLVEVAPNATPPVCRLLDYGKFRYEQSKKEREARKNQRQAELKELRLKPKTDDHDLDVKANHARRFLLAGDKVKFTVRFRGREMAHTDIGRSMLDQIAENLRDVATMEQKPMMEGRACSMVLAPNQKAQKEAQKAAQAQSAPKKEQPARAQDARDDERAHSAAETAGNDDNDVVDDDTE